MIQFNECQIGFSGSDGFIQRGIKYFTDCDYSHSFSTLKGPFDYISAIETTSTIVAITPVNRKHDESNYIELWEVIDRRDEFNRAANRAYGTYSGMWYGYLTYVWFIYRWLMRKFKVEKKVMWAWCNRNVTCTELTASIVFSAFPELKDKERDINTYSPKELRDVVIRYPQYFQWKGCLNKKD